MIISCKLCKSCHYELCSRVYRNLQGLGGETMGHLNVVFVRQAGNVGGCDATPESSPQDAKISA